MSARTDRRLPQTAPLAVAPMMDWTHRHMRHFLRLALPETWQYTEMVTADALLHGPRDRLLARAPEERRTVLQLGGSEPGALARAARLAVAAGYESVNLNCGCPSPRVQRGAFGACLMTEPDRVAGCVAALRAAVDVPVTVKCRLGVDEHDEPAFLERFVDACVEAGSHGTIVHARIALLEGLSPRQNREVPPLRHERVLDLARRRPEHPITLNGGIRDAETAGALLRELPGVMIGRLACEQPWAFVRLARALGEPVAPWVNDQDPVRARMAWVEAYAPYARRQQRLGVPAARLLRHVLNLFHGVPGGRRFRQALSGARADAGALTEALGTVEVRHGIRTLPASA